jgi:PAS domain S-box-containing protein
VSALTESGELPEKQSGETAAEAAARAARLAREAAQLAIRAENAARFAEKITRVGSAVAHQFGLCPIVDCVLDETIGLLEARFATVHLVVNNNMLKLVGQRSVPKDLTDKISELSFTDPVLAARCASCNRLLSVSVDELGTDLRIDYHMLSHTGCNSIVALPLVARGRLFGVLTFALAERHDFVEEERAALDNCADIFAIGIANAAMYEEERELHALFEAVSQAAVAIAGELGLMPSLQSIVDKVRMVLNAEYAALGIVMSQDQPFEPWVFSGMTGEQADRIGRYPRPVGTLGLVAAGQKLRVPDVCQHSSFCGLPSHHPPIKSLLAAPIHYKDSPVGNLYVANKRGADEFTPEDEQAVEVLAAHAGAIIHQSHLRDELDIERKRFKTIVEYAPHGVMFIETSTMKVLANHRAAELIGRPLPTEVPEYLWSQPEILTPDRNLVPEEDGPLRRAMRGETVPTSELIIRRPNGSEVPVLVSASPVVRLGIIEGVVLVFENISVLKELQQSREEWAALVAHDLRQPLNVLMLQSHSLPTMAAGGDPAILYKISEQMKNAVTRIARMVGDLMDVSQIETNRLTLERRLLDLDSLVREVVEREQVVAPDRRISLRIDGPLLKVLVDPLRIDAVLTNLLTNALKYSDPATPIEVDVRTVDNKVVVLVTNRGPGISSDELPRLFGRYYRTARARESASGLGLGLHIAKGLIEAHGGHIWAESTPGQTTTFGFALPCALH